MSRWSMGVGPKSNHQIQDPRSNIAVHVHVLVLVGCAGFTGIRLSQQQEADLLANGRSNSD